MNQQPDKLFREKVENFQMNVSANAWNRVEENLSKKNSGAFWLKVAASMTIVAVSLFMVLSKQKSIDSTKLATKTKDELKAPTKETIKTLERKLSNPTKKIIGREKAEQKLTPKETTRPVVKEQLKKSVSESAPTNEVTVAQREEPVPSIQTESENTIAVVEKAETEIPAAKHATKVSHVTIVITANEADEKYLDKKSLADATSEEKKTSTLRKLLDTAYDLKYNQDPFGDLRQKKNEILALNFKSDKQRSQNK